MAAAHWPPWAARTSRTQLTQLRDHIHEGQFSADRSQRLTPETQSWLARLLVIRTCGHLEQVVNECTQGFVTANLGGPVRDFTLSWMKRSSNPSYDNLLTLWLRFSEAWAVEFTELLALDDEALKRDLDWMIDARHRIAHGASQGAAVEKALAVYESTITICDWIITTFEPTKPNAGRRARR